MNRQKQILFVLLIVLGLALIYSYWSSPRQGTVVSGVDSDVSAGTDSLSADRQSAVDLQKVNLTLLEASQKKYRGYKRDIFNYYTPKPKPVPKPVVKVEPKPVPKPQPKPVVTPQIRKQLAKFTFLGFLLKDTDRTIFLSKQDELFLVKKADYFGEQNQFEVVEIDDERMSIRQTGANNLIEIILKEEEPLIPSFTPGESGALVDDGDDGRQPVNRPAGTVPAEERHRKWFKDTQPEPTEQSNDG